MSEDSITIQIVIEEHNEEKYITVETVLQRSLLNEVTYLIKSMKNGKPLWCDKINVEHLQYREQILWQQIVKLSEPIWDKETMPEEQKWITHPIHKKGDKCMLSLIHI